MAERQFHLQPGESLLGLEVTSVEADFEAMTWTFQIDSETPVGAGRYLLIQESQLLELALKRQEDAAAHNSSEVP